MEGKDWSAYLYIDLKYLSGEMTKEHTSRRQFIRKYTP